MNATQGEDNRNESSMLLFNYLNDVSDYGETKKAEVRSHCRKDSSIFYTLALSKQCKFQVLVT